MTLYDGLRQIKLLAALTPAELEAVCAAMAPHTTVRRVPKGCLVIDQGELPGELALLLEGGARWTSANVEGKEYTMATADSPCILTLLLPAMNGSPHFARVVTTGPSTLATLSMEAFRGVLRACPRLNEAVVACIFRRAVRATNLSDVLRLSVPRNRIAAFLLTECTAKTDYTFRYPFSISDFAYFLNLARPTFSRELHRLAARGLIVLEKNRIRVPDREALQQVLLAGDAEKCN